MPRLSCNILSQTELKKTKTQLVMQGSIQVIFHTRNSTTRYCGTNRQITFYQCSNLWLPSVATWYSCHTEKLYGRNHM